MKNLLHKFSLHVTLNSLLSLDRIITLNDMALPTDSEKGAEAEKFINGSNTAKSRPGGKIYVQADHSTVYTLTTFNSFYK